ncbi:MAG: flavin reductase [Ruminococcus sp.]|nr:flavin reductase [Ruminococcus sp.]
MLKEIDIKTVDLNPFKKIGDDWALLMAGEKTSYNSMTISWGYMGVMCGKNVFLTVVRPQRYTKKFVDSSEYFTVSFFDDKYKKTLAYLGSHSGADVDKMNVEGMEAEFSDNSVYYKQASLVLVCKKLFSMEQSDAKFYDEALKEEIYPTGDFHTFYTGEIVKAYINE